MLRSKIRLSKTMIIIIIVVMIIFIIIIITTTIFILINFIQSIFYLKC